MLASLTARSAIRPGARGFRGYLRVSAALCLVTHPGPAPVPLAEGSQCLGLPAPILLLTTALEVRLYPERPLNHIHTIGPEETQGWGGELTALRSVQTKAVGQNEPRKSPGLRGTTVILPYPILTQLFPGHISLSMHY